MRTEISEEEQNEKIQSKISELNKKDNSPYEKIEQEEQDKIRQLQYRDNTNLVWLREWLPWIIIVILIVQNAALFWFMFDALGRGEIDNVARVIYVAFVASALETSSMLYVIVRWVFDKKHELTQNIL